jgi:formylglycine-generating enzyme required for sulfatase activity
MKKTLLILLIVLTLAPAVADTSDRSILKKEKPSAPTSYKPAEASNVNYYALIIGNDDYRYLPGLRTAANDAREVENILKTRYGFKTRLILNATRKDILSGINEFRKTLGRADSFLIYYAGHGVWDKSSEKSYWLPIDARSDDPVDWIISDDITSNLRRITARHILVVSDSCYSGTLTRAIPVELQPSGGSRDEFIRKMIERPSRTLMASGGNEPVSDSGGGAHSVFAAAFLKALSEAGRETFTAEELFHGRIKAIVAGGSAQVPEYHDIRNSGHEGGDFVFSPAPAVKKDEAARMPHGVKDKRPGGRAKTADRIFTDPVTGMEFVFVPGGCFQMGDTLGDGGSDETPVHEVCLDDFYIGRQEATLRQWTKIMEDDNAESQSPENRQPVVGISRNNVDEFIKFLNRRTNEKYRLPTEAEWEYACRSGGRSERFSGLPDNLNDHADYVWYASNSGKKVHPVGAKKPNGLGLYDMSGNVWEWVEDWYSPRAYAGHGRQNPIKTADGDFVEDLRVIRGGGFGNSLNFVRCAARSAVSPGAGNPDLGFRLVKEKP